MAALLGAIVRRLPRRAALALGRALGRLLAALDRRHVRIAADNLHRAFPDWDEPRCLRTARAVYAHFGAVMTDVFWLEGRAREEVLALVEVEGREHAEAAIAAGRGAIYCMAHIGNWELHGIAHGWLLGAMGGVVRPLDNPGFDARLRAFRMASGNQMIYKRQALGQVIRAVRAGRGVAMLLDQNVKASDGIFVTFFGRPAATTPVAAALAAKTGCALVPCYAELLGDGRYRIHYEAPLHAAPSGDRDADTARLTQALASRTEAWIRRIPEQWQWMHRRWKTQPKSGG